MVSKAAKALFVAMGVLLLIPTLAMQLQNTDSLERFHNRSLIYLPKLKYFFKDPADYLAKFNEWMADRIYPVTQANYVKNEVAYFVLHSSPSSNITVSSNGLVFDNGTDIDHENNLVTLSCLEPADPGNRARLETALARIASFGRQLALPVDLLVVPTIPLLYGDRLPLSLPPRLRAACAAGFASRGPMSLVRAPEDMRFVYPFAEMAARRDDLAMFPNGNYHASGLSIRIATDAYLQAIGAPKPTVTLRLTERPSEVLESRGVIVRFPVYVVEGSDAVMDGDTGATLTEAVSLYRDDPGQVVTVYRDPTAPDPRTILMLSDSFGTLQRADFATAFRTVVQMQTPHRDIAALLDAISRVVHPDRLVLVFNDTNLQRLSEVGERLSNTAAR